jgi:hypothetical protein
MDSNALYKILLALVQEFGGTKEFDTAIEDFLRIESNLKFETFVETHVNLVSMLIN